MHLIDKILNDPKEMKRIEISSLNQKLGYWRKQEEKAKIDKSANLVGHVTEELFCDMNHEGCHELGGILSGICKSMHNTYSEMKGIHEEAPPEAINILEKLLLLNILLKAAVNKFINILYMYL